MQKISSYHLFILEIQWILESCDQLGHTHFWPCPPKIFLINFYFMRICINKQKIRLFHWFVLEIWFIKKFYNLIGWEHFGPYLRNQNLPKYGICAGTQPIIYNFSFTFSKNQWQIFQYIQKTLFLAHFWSIFWAKNFFSGKSDSVMHNFIWISNFMPKFRKN